MANVPVQSAVTISSGSLTLSGSGLYPVIPEGGTGPDFLDSITGLADGDIAILMANDANEEIIVRHNAGGGNIRLQGGLSFTLNNEPDWLHLIDVGAVIVGFGIASAGTLIGILATEFIYASRMEGF